MISNLTGVHIISVSKDTDIIEFPFNYMPAINKITVNDVDAVYTVTDKTATFDVPLLTGDEIKVYYSTGNIIHLIHNKGRSLFKGKSEDPQLSGSMNYTLEFYSDNISDIKTFKTAYNELYAKVKDIRLLTNELLVNVSDEDITEIIHMNSLEALEKQAIIDEEEGTIADDNADVPRHIYGYVKYKTAIDIVYSIYLTISGNLGGNKKLLRNISIEKTVKLPYISDMISELKRNFREYDEILSGGKVSVASFVKAGDSPYPITTGRRSF